MKTHISKYFFRLAICCIISSNGCTNDFCSKIESKIAQNCLDSTHCQVDLKQVYDFEWDYLYVLTVNTNSTEIESLTGYQEKDRYLYDNEELLLFTQKDSIIKKATIECNDIGFYDFFEVNYLKLARDTAKFNIQKEMLDGGREYFILTRK